MHASQPMVQLTYVSHEDQEKKSFSIPYEWFTDKTTTIRNIELTSTYRLLFLLENNILTIICKNSRISLAKGTEEDNFELANINITITEELPIHGLHVYTDGIFTNNKQIVLEKDIYLYAKSLFLNECIVSKSNITLLTPLDKDSSVIIIKGCIAQLLSISTEKLDIRAKVAVEIAHIFDCDLNIAATGKLLINSTKNKSYISAKNLLQYGEMHASNTEFITSAPVIFLNKSITHLINCLLFTHGFKVHVQAKVDGKHVYIDNKKLFVIDGNLRVDEICVLSDDAKINGYVWGGTQLQMQLKGEVDISGVVASYKTSVKSQYLCVMPRGDSGVNFGPYAQGALVGETSLSINAVAVLIASGGELRGSNLQINTGLYISLLGIIVAFDFVNLALIELPYGLDFPYSPAEYWDLLSVDKIFRLSLRFAGNYFIKLKSFLSLISFIKPFAIGTLNSIKTVLTASYNDLRHLNSNDASELLGLVSAVNNSIRENAGSAYANFQNFRDIKAIEAVIKQTSTLDVVNNLLRMKGYYLLGSSIYQIGSNTAAFTNDANNMVMQGSRDIGIEFKNVAMSLREIPSNIKQLGSRIEGISNRFMRSSAVDIELKPGQNNAKNEGESIPPKAPEISMPAASSVQPANSKVRMQLGKRSSKRHPEQAGSFGRNPGDLGIALNRIDFNAPQLPLNPHNHNFSPPQVPVVHNGGLNLTTEHLQGMQASVNHVPSVPPTNGMSTTVSEATQFTAPPLANTYALFVSVFEPQINFEGIPHPTPEKSNIIDSSQTTNPLQESGLWGGISNFFNGNKVRSVPADTTPNTETNGIDINTSLPGNNHVPDNQADFYNTFKRGREGLNNIIYNSSVKIGGLSPSNSEQLHQKLRKTQTTFPLDEWYAPAWIDTYPNMAMQFAEGMAAGMLVNGAIFKAASIKYLGAFIRGAGLLGCGVIIAEAFNMACEFEKDNFMYTTEYEEIINNPFIPEERKTALLDESLLRQNNARTEAEQLRNLAEKFTDNPILFGFGIGSLLTIEKLPGSTLAANAYMNLRIRNPFKSLSNERHIEFLNKIVKSPFGIEHIEISSGGVTGFENFAKARTMATIRANLGEDAVPYLSRVGPHENNVYVGMSTKDLRRLWRLDLNTRVPKGKPPMPHINWQFYDEKTGKRYFGAITIEMSLDEYYQLINRFPRKLPLIGG